MRGPGLFVLRAALLASALVVGSGTVHASGTPAGVPARTAADGSPSRPPASKDDATTAGPRHGYTSPHTAYATDHELRLELETYANEAAAGAPVRTTVTLTNLSRRRVELEGPKGCLLFVGARREDGSGERDTVLACAGTDEDPRRTTRSGEPERLTLEPGASHAADATLVFPRAGEWMIVSRCMCADAGARPTPGPAPLPGVGDLLSRVLGDGTGEQPERTSRGRGMRDLGTPPIRMLVA